MSIISEEMKSESEVSDLRGLRGWLVFVGIGLCLTPLRLLKTIGENVAAFNEDTWNALTMPGAPAYHPLWAPLLIGETILNVLLLGGSVLALWLFFGKRRIFPRVAMVWLLGGVIVSVLDLVLVQTIPAAAAGVTASDIREVIQAGTGALIWIPYFLASKRVRATFVE
jgi:hypothetical protein